MPFDQGGQDHNASPFNRLPPVAVALALAIVAVELVLELAANGYLGGPAGIGWRQRAFQDFSVWKPWMAAMFEAGRYTPELFWRFVTYPFLQYGFTQMIFSVAILLALGKFVGEVFSGPALLLCWLGSAVIGAAVFLAATDTQIALAGGMTANYGLVGAFTWLLWQKARMTGGSPAGAFRMVGVLIGIQLLFLLMEGGAGPVIIAELGGFAGGFLLSFVLAPGGTRALMGWLRRR